MEIKVLNKIFDLLEMASAIAPRELTSSEAAEALGIPRSTSVRLLKLLTEKGYLEQLSPRKGYIIGPAAALLSCGPYQELSLHGERLLRSFAVEMKVSAQICLRQGNCRLIICGFNGDPGINLDLRRIRRYDLNLALSGHILLSHAPETDQREVIASWGEDRGVFTGLSDEQILAHLKEVSLQKHIYGEHKGKQVAVVPIRIRGRVIAAAGAVWRNGQDISREEILDRLVKTAEQIEGFLNIESF